VVNLFILCNSRGATLGLIVGAFAALLLARSGHRFRMLCAIPLVIAAFLFLADPEFISRQQTTADYQEQGTAIERMASWRGGLDLIRDHPLGAGGDGYELLSPKYIPDIVASHDGAMRAPHNTFVLVTAEWGVLGLFMYLGLMASTLLMLQRVRRLSTPDDGMFYRALALQVGLIATLTASTFADRLYGESVYWMCGLAVALYRVQHHQQHQSVAEEPDPARDARNAAGTWGRAPAMAR
jgi:O-antigen ligase